MKALIFVYASTSFRIGGSYPLKQLQLGKNMTFADSATVELSASGDVDLPGGVYLIYTDADDIAPDVVATTGTRGEHYDIIVMTGKDKWPDPPGLTGTEPVMAQDEFQKLVEGIRGRMQQQIDEQIRMFTESLGR